MQEMALGNAMIGLDKALARQFRPTQYCSGMGSGPMALPLWQSKD